MTKDLKTGISCEVDGLQTVMFLRHVEKLTGVLGQHNYQCLGKKERQIIYLDYATDYYHTQIYQAGLSSLYQVIHQRYRLHSWWNISTTARQSTPPDSKASGRI